MANELRVPIIGNLTRDLEARMTKTGKAMATGCVAHTERVYNRQTQQFEDGPASFYDLVIFDPDAANALECLKKGMRVIVFGKQRVKTFERRDGSKGTAVEIVAEEIGPSLKFRKAHVDGGSRGGYQQGQPAQDPWSSSQPDQAAQADPFANTAPSDSYGGDDGYSSPQQDNAFAGW